MNVQEACLTNDSYKYEMAYHSSRTVQRFTKKMKILMKNIIIVIFSFSL